LLFWGTAIRFQRRKVNYFLGEITFHLSTRQIYLKKQKFTIFRPMNGKKIPINGKNDKITIVDS
jgi:calcineurin-like phosphoesterase family protein